MTSAYSRLLRIYVGTVIAVAAALVGLTAAHSSFTAADRPTATALTLLLVFEGHLLRVRSSYRQHHHDLNFVEATLAVAFIHYSMLDAAAIVAVATALTMLVQRVSSPVKALFNTAQWTLAALAGYATYHAVAAVLGGATGEILALAAGTLAAIVTNQIAFTTAVSLTSGRPAGPRRLGQASSALTGRLLSAVVSVGFGIVLGAAAMWNEWTIACSFVPLFVLHWASKGYAEARADRLRLEGLQAATHALSVSFDVDAAIPAFLASTRGNFEVTRAELWLYVDGRLTRAFADGRDATSIDDRLFATWLDGHVTTAGSGTSLTVPGWGKGIVVPLRSGVRVHGALCLLDRTGMEGFEDGELAVATALGNELVGFLERASLVDTVIEERRKLGRIVDQTSDGIATLAVDGTVMTWNRALETITGYPAEELVGTTHLGLLRARDDSGADVWLERWATLENLPERVQVRTADGSTRWLSCSFSRTAQSDGDGDASLIVVARDVTAAHELERLKDDFVAVVSHELRTPLVPIKGWAQMLLTRGDRLTPAQRRDALESIQAQAQRLERLVLNILEASRIEGGLEPIGSVVDVAQIAGRIVDEMLPTSATHVVRLHGTGRPLLALGQAVWVERVLANLLANAVKYSPAETTIDVSVAQQDAEVVIRVEDEGPGIPVAWRERIFERFERVPESRTQTGTGLGLYITRQLVLAMGGAITVESTLGSGTTFTVRLRAAKVAVPAQARPADESAIAG